MSLTVISLDNEDIAVYCGDANAKSAKDANLENAILETARDYIWSGIDCTDLVSDCVSDAVRQVFADNGIEFDTDYQDEDDGD